MLVPLMCGVNLSCCVLWDVLTCLHLYLRSIEFPSPTAGKHVSEVSGVLSGVLWGRNRNELVRTDSANMQSSPACTY